MTADPALAVTVPLVGPLIRGVAGFATRSVIDVVAAPVAAAGAWVVKAVGALVATTTRPQLDKRWFQDRYSVMVALAVITLVGVLVASAIHAVVRQDPALVVRVLLVQLPLAVVLTGSAAGIVQWSLSLVDLMCKAVSSDTGHDVDHFLNGLAQSLTAMSGGGIVVPAFLTLFVSLIVVAGGLLLWMELVLRSVAVDAATLFLPLALVTMSWPGASRMARRLAEIIAALVLSKLVVVGILSLAAGAIGSGDVQGVLTGTALLLLAAGAPFTLLRLIPLAEFGAIGHLDGLARRAAVRPAMAAWSARSLLPVGGGGPGWVGVSDGQDGPTGAPTGAAAGGSPGTSPGMAERAPDWYGSLPGYSPGAGTLTSASGHRPPAPGPEDPPPAPSGQPGPHTPPLSPPLAPRPAVP